MWEKGLDDSLLTESQVVNRWIIQGMERTRLEDARGYLTRALQQRFGTAVPPEVLRVIEEQPSLPMLEGWFDEALAVASMDDFVAVLRR